MRLVPSSTTLIAGSTLTIDIQIEADTRQVAGADAFINFDTNYLEAISITPITTKLGTVSNNAIDNTNGYADYSALKKIIQPYPTGTFEIATIIFSAKQPVALTTITFTMSGDRTSAVAFEGDIVYGAHTDATVELVNAMQLTTTATLQGGSRLLEGLNVSLTLKLFTSDQTLDMDNILTEPADYEFTTAGANLTITDTVLETKTITFKTDLSIPPETYHISLSTPHCLVNLANNVAVNSETPTLNMGTLIEGNSDDSVQIAGADFSALLNDYLQTSAGPEWNGGRCDFDRDGQVTTIDFSLLKVNYNMISPQVVE